MRWKLHVRFGERAGETDQQETLTPRPGPTQPHNARLQRTLSRTALHRRATTTANAMPTKPEHAAQRRAAGATQPVGCIEGT